MNKIIEICPYSEMTARLVIENRTVAMAARTGHFVIMRFSDNGVRIPFTIVDSDPAAGTIDVIIHKGANLGDVLQTLEVGMEIPDLLGPLGNAIEIKNYGTVICCGDGAGFVPLLPVIKAMKRAGNRVVSVLSEQSAQMACLSGEVEKNSDETVFADGDAVDTVRCILDRERVDFVYESGPTMMMKDIEALTRERGIPTNCILNMIMIDGIGLCGICRVMVDGKRKLTCIDGPTFDAHLTDFDQLLNRQRHFV